MSEAPLLKEINPGRVEVYGLLSVETVADYQKLGFKMLETSNNSLVFDLCEAEVVGSAALALIISWFRESVRLDKEIKIENAPQHLLEMADVSGVREIIPFTD